MFPVAQAQRAGEGHFPTHLDSTAPLTPPPSPAATHLGNRLSAHLFPRASIPHWCEHGH